MGGKTIRDVNFRAKYRVSIMGVKKGDNTQFLPMADHIFDQKEHLMVIGRIEDVERLLRKFENGKNRKNH